MEASQVLSEIYEIIGQNYLITNPPLKKSYLSDWRGRYTGNALAIVKPQTVSQIARLVKFCQIHQISIIPQGGNTSLCGGATPLLNSKNLQLIINTSLLNKVIEIDTKNDSITVEAGCTLEQIIQFASEHNRYFPLSIAAMGTCQIGGNIATNAGGIHVIKYGMIRDLVLGLEVVLPDGQIINQLNRLRKNNTYVDLKQLFIGSEGTLGIITKAVLKLSPKPKNYITGLAALSNISEAISLLNQLKQDFNLSAYEIIGETIQNMYNAKFPTATFPLAGTWLVLFDLENDSLDQAVEVIAKYNLNQDKLILSDETNKQKLLWQMRENIPLAEKSHGIAIKHDISLPISQIESFISLNQRNILGQFPNAKIITFGHLGDGNLHYNVQLATETETLASETQINHLVYTDVLELGGSISAEHGIGQLKMPWYKNSIDSASYNLAKQIKQSIDPNNLFNPNKVFAQDELS